MENRGGQSLGDGPKLHDALHAPSPRHRPVEVRPLPHRPGRRRGGARPPHDNGEDQKAGGTDMQAARQRQGDGADRDGHQRLDSRHDRRPRRVSRPKARASPSGCSSRSSSGAWPRTFPQATCASPASPKRVKAPINALSRKDRSRMLAMERQTYGAVTG